MQAQRLLALAQPSEQFTTTQGCYGPCLTSAEPGCTAHQCSSLLPHESSTCKWCVPRMGSVHSHLPRVPGTCPQPGAKRHITRFTE